MMSKGRLIVISGPSGVGKSTIVKKIMEKINPWYSISMTTRKKRDGEIDGVNYFFVNEEEFKKNIETGNLLEYATYNGNYYGTPKNQIDQKLSEGRDVLCEIEVKGAKQIKKLYPESILIFIMPPSIEKLRERLLDRATEDIDTIERRIKIAKEEMMQIDFYDYKIVNDNLELAINEVLEILTK